MCVQTGAILLFLVTLKVSISVQLLWELHALFVYKPLAHINTCSHEDFDSLPVTQNYDSASRGGFESGL